MARLLYKYPNAAKALTFRSRLYNDQLRYVPDLERQRTALIVAPHDIIGTKTLTKYKDAIVTLYQKGYQHPEAISRFI